MTCISPLQHPARLRVWRWRAAVLAAPLLAASLSATGPELLVRAPSSLTADADRVQRLDRPALRDALAAAGLAVPVEVRATLIAEDDPRSRDVPDWVVGAAVWPRDILLFPRRTPAYPHDSLESVVRHEIVHLALSDRAGGRPLPRWFHEGVAVSVDAGWSVTARLRLLLTALDEPTVSELGGLFASQAHGDVTTAYLLAAALVDDVRDRHGRDVPGAIAASVASGNSFDRAFRIHTGGSTDFAARQAWRGYRQWANWLPVVTSGSAVWGVILLLAVAAFVARGRRRARRRRLWAEEEAGPSGDVGGPGIRPDITVDS